MCNRPITQDGFTYACRTCDDCIATRRHNWVARAMMEKTQHKHCISLTLTYDDETQANRDAAKMFAYVDVRGFLKRLRAAARYADPKAEIRFICAGEQGSRHGRCHWHMIIFSDIDITTLGKVTGIVGSRRREIKYKSHMMSAGKRKRRLDWSLWGHGYVSFQEPDQGGMNYVLSYCLKDQFTHEKSRGTIREAKAENFATGLFRMSKRPAIGEAWLYQELAEIEAKGAVLPALKFKVPDFHGYYVPSGSFRQKALRALVEINDFIKWSTGADAPQWASLLSSCQDNPPDLEILTGVKVEKEETYEEFEQRIKRRSDQESVFVTDFKRRCGRVYPCFRCRETVLTREQIAELKIIKVGQPSYWVDAETGQLLSDFDEVSLGDINPYCQKRGTPFAREVYPDSRNHDV